MTTIALETRHEYATFAVSRDQYLQYGDGLGQDCGWQSGVGDGQTSCGEHACAAIEQCGHRGQHVDSQEASCRMAH